MKYAVLTGKQKFEIKDGEIKSDGKAVKMKVTHIGVCGTDIGYWNEGDHHQGIVVGHEYSGIVIDPGINKELKAGDRIAGYTQNVYNEACGHCPACLAGKDEDCSNRTVRTWKGGELEHPGAFSEETVWFPHSVLKLPEGMSSEEGALIEPFAVGLHAIGVSNIKPNDKVFILGAGIIGMACAEWCRIFGAGEITVTEVNEEKIQRVKDWGIADHVVKATAPDIRNQLNAISQGGYDIVIDCAAIPSAFQVGLDALKKEMYMRVTGVGLPHTEFPVDYGCMVLKQIIFRGSKGHTFDEFKITCKAIADGRINASKYVTRRVKLREVQAGFEAMAASRGIDTKVIVETE